MADDVKLKLGIDVEDLQRSASQATNALSQAFSQGISASLLGNGLAPVQGPVQQGGAGGGGVAGIIAAVQQVNRTLVIGFNALAGGVYLGGGGAGGGGVAGGGAAGGAGAGGPPGLAGPAPRAGVAGGALGIASQILSRAGDLAGALMPSSMRMFMGGFYGTDVMGFAHNLLSQVPVAGRLLGAVTGPFHQVMQQNDEFKNMQYEMFRDAGPDAMNSFTNLWTDDDYREQFVKRFGLSRAETQQLVHASARRGIGQGQGMEEVLNMQGSLGLGTEAAETMGGLRRAGLRPDQGPEVMANAIGVAVATGLERGRWGEMLTMWQRAAQSSVDTDVAVAEVIKQQQFVGGMGARFRGDTPAAQSMYQALQQMTSNTQSPLALRAAMQLTGGDFFGATARMSRSVEQPDTQLEERVVDQLLATSSARAWLAMPDGPDADRMLDRVAGVASTLGTGLSQLKIAALLKARKAIIGPMFRPPSEEAIAAGKRLVGGGAAQPDTALGPRRSQSEAQRPSGISSIQEVGPVGPPLPAPGAGQAAPSAADLGSGRFTVDPSSLGGPAAPPAGGGTSYGQFVTQGFGHPISGGRTHPGVDLAFPPGTLVTCPVDGVVAFIDRTNAGESIGYGVHIRDASGMVTKIYHIDPKTFPAGLRVGQRIARGTSLGRTFSSAFWKAPGGQRVRTHLHVGQIGPGGAGLDPMRPGGIEPGSLTGGVVPGAGGAAAGGGGGGPASVSVDVHVYTHQDASGRTVVRTRAATPVVTGSPGQLVGGSR